MGQLDNIMHKWAILKILLLMGLFLLNMLSGSRDSHSNLDLLSCILISIVVLLFSYFGIVLIAAQDRDRSALYGVKGWRKPRLSDTPFAKGYLNPPRIGFAFSYFFLMSGAGGIARTLLFKPMNIFVGVTLAMIGVSVMVAVRLTYRTLSWKYEL